MKTPRFTLAALLLAAPIAAAQADTLQIVSKDQLAQVVTVSNVTERDGEVSGVVVNRSSQPISEVKLAIRHDFLWKNEFHPGPESPSRTDEYTVAGEIPPGGSAPFTYRAAPLPDRGDGQFETTVEVSGLTQLTRAEAPPVASSPQSPPAY